MSSFDYDVFDGEYPLAVSRERYTFREALDIAISELGTQNLAVEEMFVYYGYGADSDDSAKPRNNWWLVAEKPKKAAVPCGRFKGYSKCYEYKRALRGAFSISEVIL